MSIDWVSTAGIATAVGTGALAVATFLATRSANRAAKSAEQARLEALRPILIPSSFGDPVQKVSFIDQHWLHVDGSRAALEVTDDTVYLVMSVRNVGRGLGVLDGWSVPEQRDSPHLPPERFHRLTRDIYIAPDYNGFAQIAARDPEAGEFAALTRGIESGNFWIDLLYGDLEGSQRVITRFALGHGPAGSSIEGDWILATVRHWNVDLPDPR